MYIGLTRGGRAGGIDGSQAAVTSWCQKFVMSSFILVSKLVSKNSRRAVVEIGAGRGSFWLILAAFAELWWQEFLCGTRGWSLGQRVTLAAGWVPPDVLPSGALKVCGDS